MPEVEIFQNVGKDPTGPSHCNTWRHWDAKKENFLNVLGVKLSPINKNKK